MGQGIKVVVGLATGIVLARVLDKAEYATFQQVFLAYALVSSVMTLGLPQALYYFLPGESERVRGRIVDTLVLLSTTALLFSLFILLGGNRLLAQRFDNQELEQLLIYLVPYVVFIVPITVLSPVLVVREKVRELSVFHILSRLVMGGAVVLACLTWRNAYAPLVGRVGATLVFSAVALWAMFRLTPDGPCRPSLKSMRETLLYAIPLGAATMVSAFAVQTDRFVVSSLCSLEQFAVYSIGAIEVPLIDIVTGSVFSVVTADMRRLVVEGRPTDALALFRRAAERTSLLLIPCMCFLLVSAPVFIEALFSDRYVGSTPVFRIYLLRIPVRVVLFGAAFMAAGMSKFILKQSIAIAVSNLVLTILLVRSIGMVGAAWATVISLVLFGLVWGTWAISKVYSVAWWAILPVSHLVWVFLMAAVPALLLLVIHLAIPQMFLGPAFVSLGIDAFLYGCVYLGLLLLRGDLHELPWIGPVLVRIGRGLRRA
jgi:O-antigen/teichoic acid export membrane protein